MNRRVPHTAIQRDHGPAVLTVGLAAVVVILRVLSAGMPGGGDAVEHYLHARYYWHHAEAALNEWGKPTFSLLASPFAQLGLEGMALFCACCALATALLIFRYLKAPNVLAWRWAVPLLLFSPPVYVETVFAGLTEPLFGLCSVAIVLLLIDQRYRSAMILTSFLPFVRPEYAAFAPFAIGVVLWQRKWTALAWLPLGTVLYVAVCGWLAQDPWRMFTQTTYLGVTGYGQGSSWWFIVRAWDIYGAAFPAVLLMAGLGWAFLVWKRPALRLRHLLVAWLTLLPAVAILALHSYAWYHGGMGSLGLLRVMATTVPLLVLFIVHVFTTLWAGWEGPSARWKAGLLPALLAVYGVLAYTSLHDRVRLPMPLDEVQRLQHRVAAWVEDQGPSRGRLVTRDPTLVMLCGLDPWDSNATIELQADGGRIAGPDLHHGDLVVWDAHFAANEGGAPIERLDENPLLRPLATFEPDVPFTILGGGLYYIRAFRVDTSRWEQWDQRLFDLEAGVGQVIVERFDTLATDEQGVTFTASDYPFTMVGLPWHEELEDRELIVRLSRVDGAATDSSILLTFDLRYLDHPRVLAYHPVTSDSHEFRIRLANGGLSTDSKVYLWNVGRKPFTLRCFTLFLQGARSAPERPS